MAGIPAVHLNTVCLALLCLSVLGHSMDNSTWPTASTATPEAHQSERPTTEPNTTISAAMVTSVGPDTHGGHPLPHDFPKTNITDPAAYVSTAAPNTPSRTDGQPQEVTRGKVSMATTSLAPRNPAGRSSGSAVSIVVSLVVLVVLLSLLLYILSRFRNRRWARGAWGCLGQVATRARATLSRPGIRLRFRKTGGPEDEEEDEDEGNGGRGWDAELGNGMAAESEKEKRKQKEEEEEEDDSSDDYSCMEEIDLMRERGRQREGGEGEKLEEERGKGTSQEEDKEEEGMSGEATVLEGSKEGGMEECDLTAL